MNRLMSLASMGALIVLGMPLTSAAFGQSTGAINGTVLTAAGSGAPVPKAKVHAKNLATGVSVATQSADDGGYSLLGLVPGSYEISVENPPDFPLFLPSTRKDVEVQAGHTVHIDFRLDDVNLNTLGDGGDQFAGLLANKPAPRGRTPRTREGKPDLSGVWLPTLVIPFGDAAEPLPWAEAVRKQRAARGGLDLPQTRCLPMGLTASGMLAPFRMVQTPKLLVVIDENGDPPRQVYLDRRSHPKDPNPSYMGHSVGHWEGDTLVVDTIGFNDRVWLTRSYPQTEQMHITERFSRPDLGHLDVEITLDDPGAFKKSWKLKRHHSLAPGSFELIEYVCAENNRDLEHLVGK